MDGSAENFQSSVHGCALAQWRTSLVTVRWLKPLHEFGRFFTGQVTAAGKVPPAKVLVAGAGVAGLAAIGSASSLGAIVRATDPRPEVSDQVRSIGGVYLPVEIEEKMETGDGYAKATSDAYNKRAAEIYSEQAADVDIIITTALIPGRPAPKLITAKDVALMKSGSVIVDMAAAQGGNVDGSVAGKKVVTKNGVTILGYTIYQAGFQLSLHSSTAPTW